MRHTVRVRVQIPRGRLHGIGLLRIVGAQVQRFAEELCVHAMKPELSYHVPGVLVEGMVNNALQELLNTGAWEGSGKEFLVLPADSNGQVAQELQQLQSVGYACVRHCGPPGAGPQFWQLQLQAQERITVCHVLHPGKQVLMEPRENVPLAEYSAWELLRTLEKQGWTWKAAPRSNDAQGKPSLSKGLS